MTTTGQLIARPPVSPHANLTATARTGATKSGSAIWELVCTCGATFVASVPAIKKGAAVRCPTCNPSRAMAQANKILAALPGTYAQIEYRSKLTRPQVDYRIEWMRKREMCHVGDWDRADYQGAFSPIFHAGPGKDAPCELKPRTPQSSEKLYRKRIKRAIQKAEAGGKVDDRYSRHIALHKAGKTIKQARRDPQNPFSALFAVVEQGRAAA